MRNTFFLFLFATTTVLAQKSITIDDFTTKNTFYQRSVSGINWMNDGKFYSSLQSNKVIKYDITSGQAVETIVDGNSFNPRIDIEDYSFSADEQKILIQTATKGIYRRSFTAVYFVYNLRDKTLKPLSTGTAQSYATFSPDGTKAAFVRDNNVFYVDLTSMKEVAVTNDGAVNSIINGTTDWVYEEELSFVKAFFWSPDSRKLAYYRFDESGVRQYTLQKWHSGQLYPENYTYKYPKAGEANSVVEIWIHHLATEEKVKADIGSEKDIYIPRVQWTNNPDLLSIRRMNRLQNILEVLHVNAGTGSSSVILTEKSDTYVDMEYTDELRYLDDGKRFIHASERSGYKHLYLYTVEGKLINQITSGNWEVVETAGVDEKAGIIYYRSTEPGHLERHLYSIGFNGKTKTRLTQSPGVHSINMSDDTQYYLDYFSSATQPLTVSLHNTKGNKLVKVLESNEELKQTLKSYFHAPKEFFTFPAADGKATLDGYMLKPQNFDAGKKYPALVYQYSGPRSQSVQNVFGGSNYYWFQMLAQKGYLVAVVDTRGAGFRGEAFTKQTYKQLGKMELEDLLAAGKFLGNLDYVDEDRLGIFGWSFGGYTTALAMTKGAGVYDLGIAGAPVTSWRFYDNIYTERFLQRPQENPSGYDDNSPINYAGKLQGDLLIIHGTGDDNVHVQNSLALEDALIKAGKQFRSFRYPDEPHGIGGSKKRHHLYTLMTEFILENL